MIETIILVFTAIIIYCLSKTKRPKNFPPGPKPTLFLGNVNDIPSEGHLYEAVERWSKEYGPIIGMSAVNQLFVYVTGADHALAALRKEEFQSRPNNFTLRSRSFGKCLGVFMSSGEQWTSSRKFVVKQMKAFGGKIEKENLIADEITQLMETIKDGSTVQVNGLFGLSAVNVIWKIIANRRLDLKDDKSRQFLNNLTALFRSGNPSGLDIINVFPFLGSIIPRFKSQLRLNEEIQGFVRAAIQEHKELLDPNNPLDLIDNYLVELERNNQNPFFTEEDLITIGMDLFTAGGESISKSVEFVMLYMILYPKVQAKMQEELDRVLGRSRKPMLDDSSEMHYTMAVLTEVERCNTIAPTSVMHNTTRDTTFGGYFIPKDTLVSVNMWTLGHDPKYWKNPDEFNPERFLNSDGKFTKNSIFHPFGLGNRVCVGESIARNTIFLFTTTFFEKYSISLPKGEPKPSTYALPGFTTAPRPFKITFKSRY